MKRGTIACVLLTLIEACREAARALHAVKPREQPASEAQRAYVLTGCARYFGSTGFALLGVSAGLLLASCASQRPVLYPNEQLKRVGAAAAERDVDDCMRRAEEYVAGGGRAGQVLEDSAERAGTRAAVGAAAGAAGGAVVGRAGTGAAIGAAGGAAAGATRGIVHGLSGKRSPSPVYRNFVNRCLKEKGYDPIGWQ